VIPIHILVQSSQRTATKRAKFDSHRTWTLRLAVNILRFQKTTEAVGGVSWEDTESVPISSAITSLIMIFSAITSSGAKLVLFRARLFISSCQIDDFVKISPSMSSAHRWLNLRPKSFTIAKISYLPPPPHFLLVLGSSKHPRMKLGMTAHQLRPFIRLPLEIVWGLFGESFRGFSHNDCS
jgi:hypothetical protein